MESPGGANDLLLLGSRETVGDLLLLGSRVGEPRRRSHAPSLGEKGGGAGREATRERREAVLGEMDLAGELLLGWRDR
jgi:hypothetical protein